MEHGSLSEGFFVPCVFLGWCAFLVVHTFEKKNIFGILRMSESKGQKIVASGEVPDNQRVHDSHTDLFADLHFGL